MPRVQPEELRTTLVALYGAAHIRLMEAATRPSERGDLLLQLPICPDRVAIATVPPAALTHSADPANDDPSPDTITREPDQAEAARFAAELRRDAALGDDANWPHV